MKKHRKTVLFALFMPFPKGSKHSSEARKKMSIFQKGRKHSDEQNRKIREANIGKKRTEEQNRRMSEIKKGSITGDKNPRWKGGISKNKNYRTWQKHRNAVIKRQLKDEGLGHTFGEWELLKKQYGFTCPCCGKKEPEIKLSEDHIIPLSRGGSDLIENIQPLCRSCNCKKSTKTVKYLIPSSNNAS